MVSVITLNSVYYEWLSGYSDFITLPGSSLFRAIPIVHVL